MSVVILELSSVPVSCSIPPPTTLTIPVAVEMSVSFESEVNVIVSPTSYCCPTSSTIISLTDPVRMSSTTTSEPPEPRLSTFRVSSVLFNMPSFVTELTVICEDTTKLISTSLVLDVVVIVSPSINVPSTLCNINSVTAKSPCEKEDADTTTAEAPDVCPTIT